MELILAVGALVAVLTLAVVVLVLLGRRRRAESPVLLPQAIHHPGPAKKLALVEHMSAPKDPKSPAVAMAGALVAADVRAHETLARMAGDFRALLQARTSGDQGGRDGGV